MLSDERIEGIWFRVGGYASALDASDLRMFRTIEHEATAPLIEQIKKDEELMDTALDALGMLRPDCLVSDKARREAMHAIRQRLEAKK